MKKFFLITLSSIFYFAADAQTEQQLKQIDSTRKFLATTDFVYPYLDTPPGYAGGNDKWQAYQRSSTVLQEAVKNAKSQKAPVGRHVVVVKFSVATDGSVTDVKTTGKTIGFGFEEAAMNFVKGSGKWIPANIEGENTKSTVNLPVYFTVAY